MRGAEGAIAELYMPSQSCENARLWIGRIALSYYRNYSEQDLELSPDPVILTGPNGAGKTNFLEAISLLAPGRGLRRAAFRDLCSLDNRNPWSVFASLHGPIGKISIGTGGEDQQDQGPRQERSTRIVRIDGETFRSSGVLADYVQMSWLTPTQDGLFIGPAQERRRFLDRLMISFDPSFRKTANYFERAMRQRNRLLENDGSNLSLLEGIEIEMAEAGTAIAAARCEAVGRLSATIEQKKKRAPHSPFPWAGLHLEGLLEKQLETSPALDVEEFYKRVLRDNRRRDRIVRRTLEGPHRSDLIVSHGPKNRPASHCSTGEQKALLVGLILAHTELIKQMNNGLAPLLLLDEIAAHFDELRRTALFDEILRLGAQAWMTGTDPHLFRALGADAQNIFIEDGQLHARAFPIPR